MYILIYIITFNVATFLMVISTAGWIISISKGNNIYKLILCCCFFCKAVLILREPHESIHDPKNQLQD